MGLFDKIKDNARDISMRAIEATREYEEEYQPPQAGSAISPAPRTEEPEPEPATPTPPTPDTEQSTDQPLENDGLDFEIPEETTDEIAKEEAKSETDKPDDKSDKKPVKSEKQDAKKPRTSKIIEISKEEYAKSTEKAAKARQPYTPSYKMPAKPDKTDAEAKPDTAKESAKPLSVIDVTPQKVHGPANPAFYARERAALAALASQRKMNGTVALYVTQHLNFKTRVYVDRIEYSGSFGKNVLPIEQVAWVKLRAGGTGVIIETPEGKRVVMVVKPKDRLEFADAVLKVQAMQPKRAKFKDTKTVRIDQLEQFGEGVDEIEKLAKLFDKGILSRDEFEAKKKQILGI